MITPSVLLTLLHQCGAAGSDFHVGGVVGETLVPSGGRKRRRVMQERGAETPSLHLNKEGEEERGWRSTHGAAMEPCDQTGVYYSSTYVSNNSSFY